MEEARAYFARVGADLIPTLRPWVPSAWSWTPRTGFVFSTTSTGPGTRAGFHFDMADMARKGHDFKDYICPDGIEKHSDYLKLGDRYCRVLFLKTTPTISRTRL